MGTASAWTSTAIGRSPSQVIVSTLPEAPSDAASSIPRLGAGEVAHAVALHAEEAHLAGRAEAVLDAAEHAVLAEPLALEVEDDVDHVFERAGPAIAPSLVTCPTRSTGTPVALATSLMRSTAARTWETLPGGPGVPASRSVWTELTTTREGRSASIVAITVSTSDSTSRRTLAPVHPSRRARRASCSSDSSPVQYSAGDTSSPQLFDTCSAMVDFPMPGSPPSSTTLPGTIPPPRTRSTSQDPVGCSRAGDSHHRRP